MQTESRIFARQGDIGILFTSLTPKHSAVKVAPDASGRLTLGHGSATGHRHTVSAQDADLYEHGQDLLLIVHKDTPMLHPEHENKVIPAGSYIVRRQREWFQEEARYVAD
jgi:hypothetical protein